MQIKEGRYYINRKGEVVGPIMATWCGLYEDPTSVQSTSDLIHEIPEGWTIWKGGENPAPGQMVNIMLKTGYKSPGHSISDIMDWHGDEMHVAIIAYKVKETEMNWTRADYFNNDEQLHRTDGPARMWHGGGKQFWLNGVRYGSEREWQAALNPAKEMTVAEISKALGHAVKVVK